jgi:nicotinamidase-related amidase
VNTLRKAGKIVAADTLVVFADLQAGIADLPLTVPFDRLRRSVKALARLAKTFDLPVLVTAVPGQDGSAPALLPELSEVLGHTPVFLRTTPDSFDNEAIARAIRDSGRKTLLMAGVATEVAVGLPSLTGAGLGYAVQLVLDACGGVSERSEQAMLIRLAQAGAVTTSVPSLCGELAGDFSQPVGQAAIGILFELAQG